MANTTTQFDSKVLQQQVIQELKYLLRNWYFLLLATAISGCIGYWFIKKVKPVYYAEITFVLSTDQQRGGGFSALASQLGVDNSGGADNIFSGDNIVELFKSRGLIGTTLLSNIEGKNISLLNYIASVKYPERYKTLGAFGKDPLSFTVKQNTLYRKIITDVSRIFLVYKKDKKLIFYVISATDTDPEIAYNVCKNMLDQTSRYFIETKTKVATSSLKLLQYEADSLSRALGNMFSSSAQMNDRTYNLNPSLSVQRSGILFNQARVSALSTGYGEVMRNLEMAKMNVQKETPLYRIIDTPELPLPEIKESTKKHVIITSIIGFLLMAVILVADDLFKKRKNIDATYAE